MISQPAQAMRMQRKAMALMARMLMRLPELAVEDIHQGYLVDLSFHELEPYDSCEDQENQEIQYKCQLTG
jgi:hypothetical protein